MRVYTCTGVTARWCPTHGDCACTDGMDDPGCPLHSAGSPHAADPAGSRVAFVTEWTVWPTGCDPLTETDAGIFAVRVKWKGRKCPGGGGYAVEGRHGADSLSRAGKWAFMIPRFKMRQYRWETFEEAQVWALRVVDDVVVNGRTFAEWEAHLSKKTPGGDKNGT